LETVNRQPVRPIFGFAGTMGGRDLRHLPSTIDFRGETPMKTILSIDGGGIRGIIPASTLVALEQQLGKPVRECFDFVAGASGGYRSLWRSAAGG